VREGVGGRDAGLFHGAEGAAEGASLLRGFAGELGGEAAALPVVGFGEVGELEVEGKGAGKLGGTPERELGDLEHGALGALLGLVDAAGGLVVAGADGGLAECLDFGKERGAGLLAQNFTEQGAEEADIAAQRGFFFVAGAGLEFAEAVGPVRRFPEGRGHDFIMRASPGVRGAR
jgi:hypothetical protein